MTRRKGVGVFRSALLRRKGVRGFGFGIGCSGVIQMTRDGRRQVGIGRIGVGTVTVVTRSIMAICSRSVKQIGSIRLELSKCFPLAEVAFIDACASVLCHSHVRPNGPLAS